MLNFIISTVAFFSTLLAIIVVLYLQRVYLDETKTKRMSKAAYLLLVAYILQFTSLFLFSVMAFKEHHFFLGALVFVTALSPYILGYFGRDFNKVKIYIYLQLSIFFLDLLIIIFQKNLLF
jgi:hypothetical protein